MSWVFLSVVNVSIINSIRQNQICEERVFLKISASKALIVKRQNYSSALQAPANLQSNKRDVELSTVQHWRALRRYSTCRAQAQGNRKLFHSLSTWCLSGLLLGFCRPDSSLALCRWTGRKENVMAIPVMCLRQLLRDVNWFLAELCSGELNGISQKAVVMGALCLVIQVL